MKKRITTAILVIALLLTFTSCVTKKTMVENTNDVLATGQANSSASVVWKIYADGEMVISGAGTYTYSNHGDFKELIKTVTFKSGILRLNYENSSYVESGFNRCNNLTTVYLPATVQEIDKNMFDDCPALTDVYYEGTEEQWNTISINEENASLFGAEIHYNSW